jgi:AcrR family transcriptional regulator
MATVGSEKTSNSYHHGDLRNALIIAAAELITESGSADFAMVDAARRAGVSSAAPYRHFKDKDALLEAVCQLGFLGLAITSQDIKARQVAGSREAIVAMGKGYVEYVTSRPQFYDLMWGDHGLRSLEAEQSAMQANGFHIFVSTVQQWCDAQGLADKDPVELAVKLWCMAHGLAGLTMHGQIERFLHDFNVDTMLESSTNTFLDGLLQARDNG